MSIKSEKAKHYIATKEEQRTRMRLGYIPMHDHSLEYLAKLAESDAEQKCRERAVRAFCGSCTFDNGEECLHMQGCECDYIDTFLRHYDNE